MNNSLKRILVSDVFIPSVLWIGFICTYYLIGSFDMSNRFYFQLLLSRAFLMLFCSFIVFFALYKGKIQALFSESGDYRNLAIFRIAFFGFIVVGAPFHLHDFIEHYTTFSEMPSDTQTLFPVFGWLFAQLPTGEYWVKLATVGMLIGALGGFLGFKTKYFILLFCLSVVYLFAIPNLYGKINHNHHILWFALILAFSPCSEYYSLDSRYINTSGNSYHKNSSSYQIPFAFIWIIMALIYFFPGFWKLWTSGLDWALTDNIKNHMYWKWHALGDWLPFFRIDRYPLLYKLSGLYTILFETGFIILLLNSKTRKWAAIGGILFHLGTWAFMNIFFVILFLSYVSFIPWFRNSNSNTSFTPSAKNRNKQLKLTGIFLAGSIFFFGAFKVNSWPVSVYPLFENLVPASTKTLSYSVTIEGDKELFLNKEDIKQIYSSERYRNMEHQIINSFYNGNLKPNNSLLKSITTSIQITPKDCVSVWIDEVSLNPDLANPVLERSKIYP